MFVRNRYGCKWKKAKAIYERLLDKPYGNATYREAFLADLDALEAEGVTHPDVAKARALPRKE